MGESSACLFRSFSQPSPASPKEDDPIRRALTSSVSFGRFVSESLAWDRWSAFNQNRYLEEAERFAKPGSVAEKKAYFEAHYKKIAAKKAAALLEQQYQEDVTSPVGNKSNEKVNNSAATVDLAQESSCVHTKTAEIHVEESRLNTDVLLSIDTDNQRLSYESNMETEGIEEDRLNTDVLPSVDTDNQMSPQELEMETEGVEGDRPNRDDILSVDMHHERLLPDLNIESDRLEGNRLSADAVFSVDTGPERLPQESNMETEGVQEQVTGHSLFRDEDDGGDVKDRKEEDIKATVEVPSTSGDSDSLDKNEGELPSGKPSSSVLGSKVRSSVKPSIPICPKKWGHAGNLISKKATTLPIPQALHMSISFTSRGRVSPLVSRKIVDSVIHKPVASTSSARSSNPQPRIRGSASGVSHLRVTPQLEKGRTRTLLYQSVSGSILRGEKCKSTLQNGNSKQPCGTKVKSPSTISSSFNLRSEERAAKRKEFFQKLEQKLNAEAEKQSLHLKQKVKENGGSTAWKSVSSSQRDTKANFNSSTKSTSSAMKRVSTQSYTPKIEKKLASEAQDTNCKPPWRFSTKKTDSFIRAVVPEKSYSKATPKKTRTCENTSPNIQLSVSKSGCYQKFN